MSTTEFLLTLAVTYLCYRNSQIEKKLKDINSLINSKKITEDEKNENISQNQY